MIRMLSLGVALVLPLFLAGASGAETQRPVAKPVLAPSESGLQDWIVGFQARALAAGISQRTLDAAFAGVRYDAEVIRRDRNQSEFTKTIWEYLKTAVSEARIVNGKAALARERKTLEALEAEFGVAKEVVVAIWGLESAYGTFRGGDNVIRSLTSLAYDTRRSSFFEAQLLAALQILESGDTEPAQMRGSWAGAMGHTQFMPTSYLEHAVDWTKDGKRDIWSDDPRDALASTAAYLKANGWVAGQPWGVEVRLGPQFDYLQANREITKLPSDWAALGVVDMSGKPVPDHGMAAVLLPAGAEGAAFLIFDNFAVLERYNTADAYVIAAGHLADRIGGGAPLKGDWPRQDRALSFDERIELQELLREAGFDPQKIDAKIGPLTVNAVRGWQASQGLVPDGYASPRLLEMLR